MPRDSFDSGSSKNIRVHGVHLYHSVDMPTSMAEDIGIALSGPNGSKRSSMDKTQPSRTSIDGTSTMASPNGWNNGNANGALSKESGGNGLQNGLIKSPTRGSQDGAPLERIPTRREKDLSMRPAAPGISSRSSTVMDLELMREDAENEQDDTTTSRDDGHFAEIPQSERENSFLGMSTTYVTLKAGSGELPYFPPTTTHYPNSSTNFDVERSNSALAASSIHEPSSSQTLVQQHRVSSPPAFQPSASNTNSISASTPNKLTQRHTLEVPPRISTSRTSKDATRLGEEAYASGRFSPAPNTPGRRRNSASLVRRVTRSAHSDLHLDEVPQNEDADRWADMIKAKRASKRRRKDDEEEDRVLMGTKVDQDHVNYVTAYNMLTGIRFTVSRTNAKLDRELVEADFEARHKFSFDITGNELTPSAKYDFKFKDYAPWVFRHLRQIFRIDPADYLMSLTSKYILSELGSPGKSGSFFYFSRDYKYIIKTIHHAEHKVLRKILKHYYTHVRDNPNTLLSQFYGLHRVKVPYGRKIHFVVMNNLFPPHRDIHKTFDLKGSTTGRDFKEEDLEKNPRATLKDLNWLRRNMHLELGPSKKQRFVEQMHKDVKLLQKLKIMDYSLLVGIHDISRGNEDKLRDKTLQVFQPGGDKGDDPVVTNALMRTPSKLETQRKAKELRATLKHERPVPMNQMMDKMPEEIEDHPRKDFYFYSDDRGFRATHEDDGPGEQTYYLGIIDCLTHYGLIKRLEHFWKGLSHTESQISAIPPERYGERFVHFIAGVTKSRELAEKEAEEKAMNPINRTSSSMRTAIEQQSVLSPTISYAQQERDRKERHSQEVVVDRNEKAAEKTLARHGASPEPNIPEMRLSTVKSPTEDPSDNYTLPVVEEAASENGSTASDSRLHLKSPHHNHLLSEKSNHSSAEISSTESPPAPSRPPPLTPPQVPNMPERPPPPTPPELAQAEFEKRLQFDLKPDSAKAADTNGVQAARQVKA